MKNIKFKYGSQRESIAIDAYLTELRSDYYRTLACISRIKDPAEIVEELEKIMFPWDKFDKGTSKEEFIKRSMKVMEMLKGVTFTAVKQE